MWDPGFPKYSNSWCWNDQSIFLSICSDAALLASFPSVIDKWTFSWLFGNWGFGTAPLIFQDDFLLWFYYKVLGPPRSYSAFFGFLLVLLPWYPLLRTTQTFGWVTKFGSTTSVMGWLWKHLGFCGSILRIIISSPSWCRRTMFCIILTGKHTISHLTKITEAI